VVSWPAEAAPHVEVGQIRSVSGQNGSRGSGIIGLAGVSDCTGAGQIVENRFPVIEGRGVERVSV
jgi:hypothetical protein